METKKIEKNFEQYIACECCIKNLQKTYENCMKNPCLVKINK